ncbi:hypothetical protein B0H11DRAFT_1941805 [Mycena galericulata]|nr:hypothetical protein B0H11DRAFT_1941805 [Mycena galericulata]
MSSPPPVAPAASGKKKPDEPKKNCGNKGDFHGQRLEFLESQLSEYFQKSQDHKLASFWPDLFAAYWVKFPWRLAIDQELAPGNARVVNEVLSDDEKAAKSKTETEMKKVRSKARRRGGVRAAGLTRNPFTPWLARLRRAPEASPKRITDVQFYMQHDDFKAAVTEKFEKDHWDVPWEKALAARVKVVRALFEKEPADVKKRIREEALEEQERELARWKEADEGLPSVDEEEQAEARVRFSSVVAPLLQALRAYTGYQITLVAGRQVDNQFDLVSVHAGTTRSLEPNGGLDLTQWNPDGYKEHMLNQFLTIDIDAEPGCTPTPATVQAPTTAAEGSTTQAPTTAPAAEGSGTRAAAEKLPTAIPPDLRPLQEDEDEEMPPSLLGAGMAQPATPRPAGEWWERRLGGIPFVTSPLREQVAELSEEDKERRLRELERMGGNEYMLVHENNMVRNQRELRKINERFDAVQGPLSPLFGEKRPAANKGKPPAPRKRRKTAGGGRRASDDESAEDDDDEEYEGEGCAGRQGVHSHIKKVLGPPSLRTPGGGAPPLPSGAQRQEGPSFSDLFLVSYVKWWEHPGIISWY